MSNSNKLLKNKYSSYWKIVSAFNFLVIIFFVADGYHEYLDLYQKANIESESLAIMLGQYTQATFDKFDLITLHTQGILAFQDPVKMSAQKLSMMLLNIKKGLPEVESLTITDAIGNQLANSVWVKNGESSFHFEKIFLGDRPSFIQQKKELANNLIISKPLISRTTGNQIISITRKLPYKNGKFSGIVSATLNLKSFSDFFSKIKQGQGSEKSVIALYTFDKVLLGRSPFDKDQIGKSFSGAIPIIEKIKQGEILGHYTKKAAVDHIERAYAYRALPSLSMVLVVGKNQNSILASWWRQESFIAILLILLILASVLGVILYLKKLQKSEIEEEIALQASKMAVIGEMAGGIAHEINNPLMIISSSNRLIRKIVENGIEDKPNVLKYCDNIDKTVSRITKIINGLKTVSRDSSNEDFSATPIGEILDDILSLCSEKFRSNGTEIRMDLSLNIFQTNIFCRRIQISQVFLNLFSNSFDAIENHSERWIKIDCEKSGDNLILRFFDSGNGIPLDIQDKLFRPFYTTKEVGKGTGLGLSISKTIISNHKGNIYIEKDTLNTCFVISLPIFDSNNSIIITPI